MKKRMLVTTAATAVLLIAAASGASAKEIVFKGEKCPLPIASEIGGETQVKKVKRLNALGIKDGYVAILLKEKAEAQAAEGDGAENAAAETAEGTVTEAAEGTVTEGAEGAVTEGAEGAVTEAAEGTVEETSETTVYKVYYVPVTAFEDNAPGLDLASLPNADGMQEYRIGSSSDVIFALQDDMVRLGYLAGPADGNMGPNTERAFNTIKAENGLPADGVADAVTQWLVMELEDIATDTAEPALKLTYPPVFKVEDKFAAIYDQTDADLSNFLLPQWKFSYDVFDGTGYINNGTPIGALELGEKRIDKLSLNADLRIATVRDTNGYVKVAPVIHIETIGAYCPYIQSALIKSGNKVEEAVLMNSGRKVEGVNVSETDDLELTKKAAALLTEGELVIRLKGVNAEYDLTVAPETIKTFADAAKAITE